MGPGFHVNTQYEHYFGDDINRRDYALLPVNTAQAYVNAQGYHSALSVSVTQDFGEHVSVSASKFNMLTLAAQTPLIGGGGVDTFMNRAFALPSTGVGYTAARQYTHIHIASDLWSRIRSGTVWRRKIERRAA